MAKQDDQAKLKLIMSKERARRRAKIEMDLAHFQYKETKSRFERLNGDVHDEIYSDQLTLPLKQEKAPKKKGKKEKDDK